MPPQPISAQGSANHVERAAVLFDLRKLLNMRRETAQQWPGDRNNHEQIQTLVQVSEFCEIYESGIDRPFIDSWKV